MHVDEVIFHILGRKHGDVFDAQRLENVPLEVVVEGHFGDALDHLTGPIDSDLEKFRIRFIGGDMRMEANGLPSIAIVFQARNAAAGLVCPGRTHRTHPIHIC